MTINWTLKDSTGSTVGTPTGTLALAFSSTSPYYPTYGSSAVAEAEAVGPETSVYVDLFPFYSTDSLETPTHCSRDTPSDPSQSQSGSTLTLTFPNDASNTEVWCWDYSGSTAGGVRPLKIKVTVKRPPVLDLRDDEPSPPDPTPPTGA